MKKYRKKIITMWMGVIISVATAVTPVTASEELVESGEELLYEENVQSEVIESGELVEPGLPAQQQTTPQQTTPQQTTPQQTTPEQTTPPQTTPQQTTPPQTTPPQTTPPQTTPQQTTPQQTTPPQTTPQQTTPQQTTPEQTTPEQTTPQQTTPEQTTPQQTTPQQTTPQQTTTQTVPPTTSTVAPTEEEPIMVSLFNGKTLEIQKLIDESALPEDFDLVTYSYKGNEIEIAQSKSGLILFYLKDDGDTANFYVYNEGKDSCIPFVKISSSSDQYIFLDLEEGSEELETLQATKISVNGKTLPAWKPVEGETPKEDYIVYLMNKDNIRSLYHVNIATGVIESYHGQSLDPADAQSEDSESNEVIGGDSVLQEDTSDRDEMLRKIAIFAGGAVGIVVLVIAGILLYHYLKKKMDSSEEEGELYDDELYGEDDNYEEEEDEERNVDEEIERELAALEQEEWNKIDQEETFQKPETENEPISDSQEEKKESEVDIESLNKAFNDLLEDDDDFEITDFRE